MYYCKQCGSVYSSEYRHIKSYFCDELFIEVRNCVNASCCGSVVEIDDAIIHTIILMNNKGYDTLHYCSGHYSENYGDLCVHINNYNNSYDIILNKKKLFTSLGFAIEELDEERNTFCIRKSFETEEYNDVLQANIDLYNIIKTLPKII